MKISVLVPKKELTQQQQKTLSQLGLTVYANARKEVKVEEIIKVAKGSEILAIDPDLFGGFEKARERESRKLPKVCLD